MQNIIYLAVGGFLGIIATAFIKSIKKKGKAQSRENQLTELEARLQNLENKVSQNTREISSSKSVIQDHENQILTALNYLSKMTDFKTDVQLQTHIVASERFRKYFAQLIDDGKTLKKNNNITDNLGKK